MVGGAAAVLQGAPRDAFEPDVLHSREPHNVNKLLAAVASLDANFREPAGSKIKPTRSFLQSPGHQFLMTRLGPLNLLGVIGSNRQYQSLLSESSVMEVSEGLKVRVLGLPAIIQSKQETSWERDLAVLPALRRTLEEKSKK